jgi:tRNA threonylcarbamoyladenosine biosynthesis protein TsaB
MGEVYWAEYSAMSRASGTAKRGSGAEAGSGRERLQQLSGEWATVGTGWQAWPDMARDCGLTLVDGDIQLPAAEDMLPLACHLLAAGKPCR